MSIVLNFINLTNWDDSKCKQLLDSIGKILKDMKVLSLSAELIFCRQIAAILDDQHLSQLFVAKFIIRGNSDIQCWSNWLCIQLSHWGWKGICFVCSHKNIVSLLEVCVSCLSIITIWKRRWMIKKIVQSVWLEYYWMQLKPVFRQISIFVTVSYVRKLWRAFALTRRLIKRLLHQ